MNKKQIPRFVGSDLYYGNTLSSSNLAESNMDSLSLYKIQVCTVVKSKKDVDDLIAELTILRETLNK